MGLQHAFGWLRNAIDFPLRQTLRLRRGAAQLPAEPKEGLFPPEALPEIERLVNEYGLHDWSRQSGRTDFAASLFYLQMTERALRESGVSLPNPVHALDAGCGDWFYVRPLHALLTRFGATDGPRSVHLDGVELDAYALYAGFRSRLDWALTYAERLPGVQYLPMDMRRYQAPVDMAFQFFPFLFANDVRRWGLPRRYLRPADLLQHVYQQVRPGGTLLVANLGEEEREAQHALLRAAGIRIAWWGKHTSPLFAYRQPRFVTVAIRT